MTNEHEGPGPGDPGREAVPGWIEAVRSRYNAPGEVPRAEMWSEIREELARSGALSGGAGRADAPMDSAVVDLTKERVRRAGGLARPGPRIRGPWRWAAAAAVVLAVGIGIGRWSMTSLPPIPGEGAVASETPPEPAGSGVELAARLHFERMEPLLAAVRSDARTGRVDDSVGPWARGLLSQTRLLMDAREPTRDETQQLLTDLELVLVQILGAIGARPMDAERAREELDLAVRSLEREELLARVRSAGATTLAGA